MKTLLVTLIAIIFSPVGQAWADEAVPKFTRGRAGELIYRQGRLPDGRLLASTSPSLSGALAACGSCHRYSGMGGSEGTNRVAPITADDLFSAPSDRSRATGEQLPRTSGNGMVAASTRRLSRPAYDEVSLKRAIRSGVDSSGQALHPLMPRYGEFDDASLNVLVGYLRELGRPPTPGVVGGSLHLATIVTPGAGGGKQAAVLGVLRTWTAQHTGITLHEWHMQGAPESWSSQLDRLSERQPVFAVLSGAGGADWEAVHNHCERVAMPCIFPLVDLVASPASTPDAEATASHWSMYFSQGTLLEARILAQYLTGSPAAPGRRIVQVHDDEAGDAAARALQSLLPREQVDVFGMLSGAVSARAQAAVSSLGQDDVLIVWAKQTSLQSLWPALTHKTNKASQPLIFLSASKLSADRTDVPLSMRERTLFVSPYLEPRALRSRTALGFLPWARQVGLTVTDEQTQAEAYAAAAFFGDALKRMKGRISREFLLETLEGAVNTRAIAGPYPQLSLGPGQRIAAKGGQILGYAQPDRQQLAPIGTRIVPP